MQTTVSAYWGETRVMAWLHKAKVRNHVLVMLIHGHNSRGDEGRYIEIAKYFVHRGIDCLRFSVTRRENANGESIVTTLGEEIGQAKAIAQKMRHKYESIVALGHSQGGIIALHLALDGLSDGVVFLMSAFDTTLHAHNKLQRLGLTTNELKEGMAFKNYDGRMMHYTKAIIDELTTWEPYTMIGNWYGPSLFILGTKDTSVQEQELRHAFELANDPKEWRTLDSSHKFTNDLALPLVETVATWMQKNFLNT